MAASFLQLNQGLPAPPSYSSDDEKEDSTTCISPANARNTIANIKSKPKSPLLHRNQNSLLSTNMFRNNSAQQIIAKNKTNSILLILPKSPKQKKCDQIRAKAVNELIATEITYIQNLKKISKIYSIPLSKNTKILSSQKHSILFPVIIHQIVQLNTSLLKSMQSNKEFIGKSILSFIPYLKMYQSYMHNYESALKLLSKLSGNTAFQRFLKQQKSVETNGLTLESFLILPIQRIPRYELCLKAIIERTNDTHRDKKNLIECYDKIRNVNMEINTKLKEYQNRNKVSEIKKKLTNLEFELCTPSRFYIFEGFLTKISRKKHIKYLFILFNDALLYCVYENKNKLTFHRKLEIDEYFSIRRVCILDSNISDGNYNQNKRYFEIRSLQKSFTVYADTHEGREKWIGLISQCCDSNRNINSKRSDSYVRYRKSMSEINNGRMKEVAPILTSHNLVNQCQMKQCNKKFGLIAMRKKHNCAYCGRIVCSECSQHCLPHFNPNKKHKMCRVCDECWSEHKTPYMLNVDQMNFVSKCVPICSDEKSECNDKNEGMDLWDKYGFENKSGNCKTETMDIFDTLFESGNGGNEICGDMFGKNEKMKLDFEHENVRNLRLFGFGASEIQKAWDLMKKESGNENVRPQNGQIFMDKMLNYLGN